MPQAAPVTTTLNDVDLAAVGGLIEKVKAEPDIAATKWAAEVAWSGGFRSEAKVRAFAPARSDEPAQLGGTDTGPNPVEQVLAALGNCLAVGYAANATAAGIEIRDLRIEVSGEVDLHAFLGLRPGHAGFANVSAKVHLDSDASPQAVQALHEKVTSTSPVGHTLAHPVAVSIELA